MDQLQRRRQSSKPNGCSLSGPWSRRCALWFIVMTYAVKACQNVSYLPKRPGQTSKWQESASGIYVTGPQTNCSTARENCKFPLTHPVGENDLWFYTHWLKDESISGDDRDQAFEAGQELIQRWIQRKHGFQISSLVRRAIERASGGTGDAKPLLIFTLLGPEDKAAFLDYALRGISIEQARDEPVAEIYVTTRPEEAETCHKQLTRRALHFYVWNAWSCSGPNAGGGHEAELRLAHPFLLDFANFRFRSDKSADARVGGVLGRYPHEVQCSDTLEVYIHTNQHGPGISKGTPQGNPRDQFREMLNELEAIAYICGRPALLNRPAEDPKFPLLSFLSLLFIRIAFCSLQHSLPLRKWSTIRRCRGQYRRVRSLRAAGISKDLPQTKKHFPKNSSTGCRRPRIEAGFTKLPRWARRAARKQHLPLDKILSSQAKQGIRIVTWNSGGLHSARWTELLQWLQDEAAQNKPVHICLVQETHWASSTEFNDPNWLCVHSCTGSREGGILTMISRRSFRD